mgnify:CR=1
MTIIKTFDTEEAKSKFPKKYLGLALLGLISLTLIEIWASNTVVAFGEKLDKLTDAEKNLKLENQILENEIAKNSSLVNLASKSAALGFSSAVSIQYIR